MATPELAHFDSSIDTLRTLPSLFALSS